MTAERTGCIFCGSEDVKVHSVQADIRYHPDELFLILRCRNCGLLFTAPAITQERLGEYYPAEYAAYMDRESLLEALGRDLPSQLPGVDYCLRLRVELMGRGVERVVARVRNAVERERLGRSLLRCLDTYPYALPLRADLTRVLYIGSGNPRLFRSYLALPGLTLATIDINEEMCSAYREAGIDAHHGFIATTEFSPSSFDVIFSSMVLEHLLQPREEMRRLTTWLAQDGVMVCAIPDMGSIEWKTKPVFYDVPRHRAFYTRKTATMLFEDAGLRVVKRLHPPFGHGLSQSEFVRKSMDDPDFDPSCFNQSCSLRAQQRSRMLSRVGQSGYVINYLRRR